MRKLGSEVCQQIILSLLYTRALLLKTAIYNKLHSQPNLKHRQPTRVVHHPQLILERTSEPNP